MEPNDWTRGSRRKLKHRRFYLKIRKNLFAVRVLKHWHRLPREIVQSSFLEILKTQMDMVLSSLL